MATKAKYYTYTLKQPARALYINATEASKPRTAEAAKTKYSVTLGLEAEDATALFQLEADAIKERYGTFTGADDYQLGVISGAKAAARALAGAELNARGKSEEEAFKIRENAQKRADLVGAFAGVLSASSRVAFHDRFLDRYMQELDQKEREQVDRFGFKLGIIARPKTIVLDTLLSFNEYKDKFYRGAFIGGSFNLSCWDRKKAEDKDGVSAYIRNLVFVKDGERLSAERSMDDEFGHYQGQATDYSPSASAPAVDPHNF